MGLVYDIFPTFLEIAGTKPSEDLSASSLLSAFEGKAEPHNKPLYFVRREGKHAYQGKAYHAVIKGDWKLLQNNPFSPLELYNIAEDPQETTDLAGKTYRSSTNSPPSSAPKSRKAETPARQKHYTAAHQDL